ncbi:MAG: hypothetical protein FJW40_00615 [Acidobacteria bacterium]|nr:hypothetical protein [Acidobacteriota bacterium]
MIESPRGYQAREFSLDHSHKKTEKQMHERGDTADDIWSYDTHFIKAAVPVAEKAGVRWWAIRTAARLRRTPSPAGGRCRGGRTKRLGSGSGTIESRH